MNNNKNNNNNNNNDEDFYALSPASAWAEYAYKKKYYRSIEHKKKSFKLT